MTRRRPVPEWHDGCRYAFGAGFCFLLVLARACRTSPGSDLRARRLASPSRSRFSSAFRGVRYGESLCRLACLTVLVPSCVLLLVIAVGGVLDLPS